MIYSGNGLDDLAQTVRKATEDIRPHRREFDSIVVRGLSGILVGSTVALRLRKPLIVVRKECELEGGNSHASGLVENRGRVGDRYLWLDDFVSSGTTRVEVWSGIYHYASECAKMVLEYHYSNGLLRPARLCVEDYCNAATKMKFRTCERCDTGRYHSAKCSCVSGTICGRGHWQS